MSSLRRDFAISISISIRRLTTSTVVGFALICGSSDAHAYCRSTTCKVTKTEDCTPDEHRCPRAGVTIAWTRMPITYRFSEVNPSRFLREEARAAIRSSFHRWSDTICSGGRTSLRFVEGEDIATDTPFVVGRPEGEKFGIYFREDVWPHDGANTIAQTNHLFGTASGTITDVNLEINNIKGTAFSVSDSTDVSDVKTWDLQSVITHEVGHYIGFAHSDDPVSIMVSSYCADELKATRCNKGRIEARRLAPDDIAGLCALYPPGATYDPPATSGCLVAREPLRDSSVVALVSGALVVLAAARRRRRARLS